jgi:hypothetical protein
MGSAAPGALPDGAPGAVAAPGAPMAGPNARASQAAVRVRRVAVRGGEGFHFSRRRAGIRVGRRCLGLTGAARGGRRRGRRTAHGQGAGLAVLCDDEPSSGYHPVEGLAGGELTLHRVGRDAAHRVDRVDDRGAGLLGKLPEGRGCVAHGQAEGGFRRRGGRSPPGREHRAEPGDREAAAPRDAADRGHGCFMRTDRRAGQGQGARVRVRNERRRNFR